LFPLSVFFLQRIWLPQKVEMQIFYWKFLELLERSCQFYENKNKILRKINFITFQFSFFLGGGGGSFFFFFFFFGEIHQLGPLVMIPNIN